MRRGIILGALLALLMPLGPAARAAPASVQITSPSKAFYPQGYDGPMKAVFNDVTGGNAGTYTFRIVDRDNQVIWSTGVSVTADGTYRAQFSHLSPDLKLFAQVLSPSSSVLAERKFSVTPYTCGPGDPAPPTLFTPLVEGPITDYTTTEWWQTWPGTLVLTIRRVDGTVVLTHNFGWSSAGGHAFVWNGRNSLGNEVRVGAYFFASQGTDRYGATCSGQPVNPSVTKVDAPFIPGPNGRIATTEMYLMGPYGQNRASLGFLGWYPAWSPNGHWLAYTVFTQLPDDHEIKQIWTVQSDGNGAVNLTPHQTEERPDAFGPVWSPDGTRIAYLQSVSATHTDDLMIMNADGSDKSIIRKGLPQVAWPSDSGGLSWSPNGQLIAFDCSTGICFVHPDGSGFHAFPLEGSDAVFSPGGGRIAFVGPSHERYLWPTSSIYTANLDGTGTRDLSFDDAWDFQPTWSPDGTRIAFMEWEKGGQVVTSLFVINTDRTGRTELHFGEGDPAWGAYP